MKRVGCIISILFFIFTVSQSIADGPGDINRDNQLTISDAIVALQVVSGMNPSGIQNDHTSLEADMNGDTRIGLEDVLYILQDTAGLRPTPWRNTLFGRVEGVRDDANGAFAWLGIPYAAPPVGSRRWLAPADPAAWTTALPAKQFGHACMQIGNLFSPAPEGQPFGLSLIGQLGQVVGSEDCLTLNIWSPMTGETNLPVLVFVHGGSNKVGGSNEPDWIGARLAAEQKVVVVTVNYRLNLFGWLYHSALKTNDQDGDSGNFGTLDLIQALKFVQNNIAAFGGDPGNVTLAGQSAGATNVWSLIVSPRAADLFHKAAPLSNGQGGYTTLAAENFSASLLRQLVIDDKNATDAATANTYITTSLGTDPLKKAYLYGKTASALITAFMNTSVQNVFVAPFYDGTVQPSASGTAFDGNLNSVPVLSGATNEEGKYWGWNYMGKSGITAAQVWTYLWEFDPDAPGSAAIGDIIGQSYLPANTIFTDCAHTGYNAGTLNAACLSGVFNTSAFWSRQTATLNKYKQKSSLENIYAYNFKWARQPEPWKTLYGAVHVADLAFLFGNFGPGLFSSGYSTANRPGREALALKMRQSLAAFMRTGNPNHASLGAEWKPWDPASGGYKRLVFDATETTPIISMSTEDTPSSVQ